MAFSPSPNHRMWPAGETGYPWLSFPRSVVARTSLALTFLVVLGGSIFLRWYLDHSQDAAPDSPVGYTFAVLGLTCMLAATFFYWRCRHSHKRVIGQLNAQLHWHSFFGVVALFLLILHSFGNFNARSGTYALYGLIAITITGITGRFLDRILSRMSAAQADVILTARGDDRLDAITSQVQTTSVSRQSVTHVIDPRGDLVRDIVGGHVKARPTNQLWDRPDESQAQMEALHRVEGAMYREQLYRYIIRYWRILHKVLVVLTMGLTIWHIVYAVELLWPH